MRAKSLSSLYRDDVRWGIMRRAQYLAFMFDEIRKTADVDSAAATTSKAAFEYGRAVAGNVLRKYPKLGKGDVRDVLTLVFGARRVKVAFDQLVLKKSENHAIVRHRRCPLVDGWEEIGCAEEKIRILCDIAESSDKGMASILPISIEKTRRIAFGDPYCEFTIDSRHTDDASRSSSDEAETSNSSS